MPEEKDETLIYVRKMGNNTKIVNIAQWQEAFYVFVGVYCEKYPNESTKLMKYRQMIINLAHDASVEGALSYDEHFRRWREQDPDNLPWENINTELHSDALATGLNSKSKDSFRSNGRTGIINAERTKLSFTKHCFTFNNEGVCKDTFCKYGHFCQSCKGNHAKNYCIKKTHSSSYNTRWKTCR